MTVTITLDHFPLQFTLPVEESRNLSQLYNVMTISELQRRVAGISWLEYINTILAPIQTVTDQEPVVVTAPSYLEQIAQLLQTTPKRVLSNFLLSRVAMYSVKSLSEDARYLLHVYALMMYGRRPPSRRKECMQFVSKR